MKEKIECEIDARLKADAEALAAELGVPLESVIHGALEEFVRDREQLLAALPTITPFLAGILKEAEEDRVQGRNISPAFDNHGDMAAYLRSVRPDAD